MSKGGSNPKGGVKRGKEQLESHTSPSLLSKKRTKCNNNSTRFSDAYVVFTHIGGLLSADNIGRLMVLVRRWVNTANCEKEEKDRQEEKLWQRRFGVGAAA